MKVLIGCERSGSSPNAAICEGGVMFAYWFKRFMWLLGYRRVLWLPSEKGLSLADFWTWEYMPWAPKRDYTEHDYHWRVGAKL